MMEKEELRRCSDCKYWQTSGKEYPCLDCKGISKSKWEPKKPPFEPEYFSGLNWRKAEKLVGKLVEFSYDAKHWSGKEILSEIKTNTGPFVFGYRHSTEWAPFFRTCPETYQDNRPTITIGGVELPRPEVDAPKRGTKYWFVNQFNEVRFRYWDSHTDSPEIDKRHLQALNIHLTEDRAREWANWWENSVIAVIKK
jgi:hypothetical protein